MMERHTARLRGRRLSWAGPMHAIRFVPPLLILLAITIASRQWSRMSVRDQVYTLVGALLTVALVVEAVGFYTKLTNSRNTAMYNVSVLVEFLLLLRMAAHRLGLRPARWVPIAAAGTVAMAASYLWRGGLDQLLLEGILCTSLLLIALCLAVLWRVADATETVLWRDPDAWLFLGPLLYHIGMLPMIGVLDMAALANKTLLSQLYLLVQCAAVLQYACMARACALARTRPRAIHG